MKDPNYMTVEELCQNLGICQATLYAWLRKCPDFPKRRKLGFRRNLFVTDEVKAWLASRPAAS
jgi:predicted DNA-binding transcriptional regulator AlpA